MEDMKADMSGAAAALHIMKAVSALTSISPLEHELHVLVPTCENMINGRATRPGDIVYAMNGKSIEILNTDAEGRLVLADGREVLLGQLSPKSIEMRAENCPLP